MDDTRPLVLRWWPTYADIVKVTRIRRRVGRATLKSILYVIVFGSALVLFSLMPEPPTIALVVLAVTLAYCVVHLIAWPVSIWFWCRRNPEYADETTVTLDPGSGVTLETGLGSITTPWQVFDRVVETSHLFFVWSTRRRGSAWISIPKRALDPAATEQLRDLLGSRVNQRPS